MKMPEFEQKYCADILESVKNSEMFDLETYPYDEIVETENGTRVPVIIVDGVSVPIFDILTNDRSDFLKQYVLPGADKAYDNYCSAVKLVFGPEAILQAKTELLREYKSLNEDIEIFGD